ncbi:MAG: outer membrane beta-barrel protein [Ginsengibacter sp.]
MPHLDDDIDNLFQRAAENYPLQSGKGDWESIAERIADKTNPPTPLVSPKNKKNKKYIAICLLLCFLSFSWILFYNSRPAIKSEANEKNKVARATDSRSDNNGIKNIDGNSSNKLKNVSTSTTKDKSNPGKRRKIAYSVNASTNTITGGAQASFYSKTTTESAVEKKLKDIVARDSSNNFDNYFSATGLLKEKQVKNPGSKIEAVVEAAITPNQDSMISKLRKNSKEPDNTAIPEPGKKAAVTIALRGRSGVYAGFVVASDFSKVNSGSFNNTGVDAGIILGFNVNEKLSFETGLSVNKKNYSSEGRNFKMDKVGSTMPSGMIINNLNSESSLLEIPAKVKYNFSGKRNSNLFIAAGVSAYIITKEKNRYNVTMNGNQEKMTGVYEKNNYKIPAVYIMSIGYEHIVSRSFVLRAEPFLKIPLQGIGVGSLPVTSAGLQVGIISHLK